MAVKSNERSSNYDYHGPRCQMSGRVGGFLYGEYYTKQYLRRVIARAIT